MEGGDGEQGMETADALAAPLDGVSGELFADPPPPRSSASPVADSYLSLERTSIELADGSTYDGRLAGGLRDGKGKMHYAGGDKYNGEWRRGLRHGDGVLTMASGGRYEGDWTDDRMHGTETFPNGAVYTGEFGTMVYPGGPDGAPGNRYEGHWENEKRHGLATFGNGDTFEGNWQAGKRHGTSTLTYARTGQRFKVMFDNDVQVGPMIPL